VLRLSPPTLDEVDAYVQIGGDRENPGNYRHYALGDHAPMADKPLPYALASFPVHLEPASSLRIYLRVRAKGAHALRAELLSPDAAQASNIRHAALQSGHLAIAAGLAAINFLLFFRLRNRIYALYGGYLLTLAVGDLGIEHMIAVFWPAMAHELADLFTAIGTGLGFTFICGFVMAMMHTRLHHPWAHRYLAAIALLGGAVFVASGSDWYGPLTRLLMINGPIVTGLLLWLPWRMIQRGEVATGRLVFMAFAVSAIGAAITFLRLLGFLPVNEFTLYSLQASSIVHMVLMMMGLSERVLAAEKTALESARTAERSARGMASQMTEDLLLSKQQIEQALVRERRMRDEQARFIDSISHEYRTPLSILRTHLDVIAARQLLDGQRLSTMNSAIQRLQDIFSNALQAHRLGRPPQASFAVINLGQLVDEILAEFRQSFPECPVEFESPGEVCRILGDTNLLKTVLRNLLDNARKYRFPNDPRHPVSCRLATLDGGVRLTVANAVDPALSLNRDGLFERYVRGASRAGTSGMGLGLYLIRRILHDHHGEAVIVAGPADVFEIQVTLPRLSE
jgi:signal transduction histidine kinase